MLLVRVNRRLKMKSYTIKQYVLSDLPTFTRNTKKLKEAITVTKSKLMVISTDLKGMWTNTQGNISMIVPYQTKPITNDYHHNIPFSIHTRN